MSQVEIQEAAADLSALIERARSGEDVVLANGGQALARLVPVEPEPAKKGPRMFGRLAGQFKIPDDFDAPLPDDILDMFEGKT